MDALCIAQIITNVLIGVAGFIGNAGTIAILTRFDWSSHAMSGLDKTTLNLMVESCCCCLIVSCLTIPPRIWQIAVGADKSVFYDNGVACWLYMSVRTVLFVNAWLLACLALTRTVAVFRPLKYKQWLHLGTVRWLLYVLPWMFGYTVHIVLSVWPLYIASADFIPGESLCNYAPVADTPQALVQYKLGGTLVLVFEIFLPIFLTIALYVAIFMKVRKRSKFLRTKPMALALSTVQTTSFIGSSSTELPPQPSMDVVGESLKIILAL